MKKRRRPVARLAPAHASRLIKERRAHPSCSKAPKTDDHLLATRLMKGSYRSMSRTANKSAEVCIAFLASTRALFGRGQNRAAGLGSSRLPALALGLAFLALAQWASSGNQEQKFLTQTPACRTNNQSDKDDAEKRRLQIRLTRLRCHAVASGRKCSPVTDEQKNSAPKI